MSRRPARASPSSRSWRDGSARPDRPRPPRWRVASWPSTVATPRQPSPRCRRASAPGARSTPPTKPPRRACGWPARWWPMATRPAPASRSRPPPASAEEIGAVVDLDIAPPRHEPAARARPHLPLLRHRGVDPAGRGDGRRRLGAAAALARPHPARRVRALAGRGGEARRRRVLRGLRAARRRHRVRGGDPAGPRPPSRRARLRAHRAHRAPRRRGDRRATATTSARPSPGPPASPRRPVAARCW